jgi:putative oxidoreductase|tara:strand:+ start:219 stop:602 length:384 start_codon:yes stop_codon:yes gene_type:complete
MSSKISLVLRILLGLLFFVIGLNKFFAFLPTPPMNEAGSSFIGALISTGYMWQLVGITEIVSGILLLANKWKGLALIFAAIISVNIVLFRVILDSNAIGLALFAATLNVLLIYFNWSNFKSLFQKNS